MRSGSFCSLNEGIALALARTPCTMPLFAGIEWQRRAAGVSDSQQSMLLRASRLASRAGQLDTHWLPKLPNADYLHTQGC